MEKVMYLLWRGAEEDLEWAGRLHRELTPAMQAAGALGLQLNIDDGHVAAATRRFHGAGDAPSAFVSVWMDSANPDWRAPFDDVVAASSTRFAAYLVTESEPVRNQDPAPLGERTDGYVNVAMLRRPTRIDAATWFEEWLGRHTHVAIETQDTSRYVQNVVARPLTASAPHWDAFVEELFPHDAMSDRHAFYDARGDDELLAARIAEMGESVGRFLDLNDTIIVPTSEYVVKSWRQRG